MKESRLFHLILWRDNWSYDMRSCFVLIELLSMQNRTFSDWTKPKKEVQSCKLWAQLLSTKVERGKLQSLIDTVNQTFGFNNWTFLFSKILT